MKASKVESLRMSLIVDFNTLEFSSENPVLLQGKGRDRKKEFGIVGERCVSNRT